jgi:hypothetical protein
MEVMPHSSEWLSLRIFSVIDDKIVIFSWKYNKLILACGVDLVGPSSLLTFVHSITSSPTWIYNEHINQIGADKNTTEGRLSLERRSPLSIADQVKKPLLIVHGAQDARVRINESGFVYDKEDHYKHKRTYYRAICCCIGNEPYPCDVHRWKLE